MTEIFKTEKISWESYYSNGMYPDNSRGIICPHCKTLASMKWGYGLGYEEPVYFGFVEEISKVTLIHAECSACSKVSYWMKRQGSASEEKLVYPSVNNDYPTPGDDMPENIKTVYEEAAKILQDSPRASAALSRLAIDMLTKELAPDGKDLNKRIGLLVEQGMPVEIQQSFDLVRIVGNNAIHPGEIDLSDNKEMATALLELLNIIVDNRISQPKRISEMYSNLPKGALEAISKRDRKV